MKYDSNATRPSYLFAPGVYSAEITEAEEKTSKKGNPMLVVELTVYDGERTKNVTDYIVAGGENPQDWKIKHLCEAAGLNADGELNPVDLVGRGLRVKLKVEPPRNGYSEQNRVVDYPKAEASAQTASAPVAPAASTDEPPP